MNFVFISPNFPHTYWQFCAALRGNGIRVLGIGDSPYDSLEAPLKAALTEYYRVDSLEDYDQVYRAVAYFAFRYGKIDWIESMNEYWLEQDARLRTDFHVTTGIQEGRIGFIKEKSLMKLLYLQAEIPTARQSVVSTREAGRAFVDRVGYPVIVKPNIGVGATNTWKLENDRDLEAFYDALPETPYVMEEFIEGIICSYDACGPPLRASGILPPDQGPQGSGQGGGLRGPGGQHAPGGGLHAGHDEFCPRNGRLPDLCGYGGLQQPQKGGGSGAFLLRLRQPEGRAQLHPHPRGDPGPLRWGPGDAGGDAAHELAADGPLHVYGKAQKL